MQPRRRSILFVSKLIVAALAATCALGLALAGPNVDADVPQTIGGPDVTSENFSSTGGWRTLHMTPGCLPAGVTLSGSHLLISEVAPRGAGTGGAASDSSEYIEINNPTADPVSLDDYYISDDRNYYRIVNGPYSIPPVADYNLRFPPGHVLEPGELLLVVKSELGFLTTFGGLGGLSRFCTTKIFAMDNLVHPPTVFTPMIDVAGTSLGTSGVGGGDIAGPVGALTNPSATNGEWVVLYRWDGISDHVCDVDYASWGANSLSNPKMDKSGVSIDGPDPGTLACPYNNDTPAASQSTLSTAALIKPNTYQRVGGEVGETASGGNGCTLLHTNGPPVCDAGGPYRAECTGSTTAVFLNGSGSSDPNGDPLTYAWSSDCPGAWFINATSATPELIIDTSGGPVSCHVTLCVFACSGSTCCDATVEVRDTTGPEFVQQVSDRVLWPPDHRYVTIVAEDFLAAVRDACDSSIDLSDVQVTSVSSDEVEDAGGVGDGNTLNDIVIVCPNTVMVRAEREGTSDGRVYVIHYEVTDGSGNTSRTTRTVSVPHDRSGAPAVEGPGPGYTVNTCGPPLAKAGIGEPLPVGVQLVRDSHLGMGLAFGMKEAGAVRLEVYDIRGRLVQSVVSNTPAGAQSIYWNGSDATGARAATGIYLLKLHAGDLTYSAKVVWMN